MKATEWFETAPRWFWRWSGDLSLNNLICRCKTWFMAKPRPPKLSIFRLKKGPRTTPAEMWTPLPRRWSSSCCETHSKFLPWRATSNSHPKLFQTIQMESLLITVDTSVRLSAATSNHQWQVGWFTSWSSSFHSRSGATKLMICTDGCYLPFACHFDNAPTRQVAISHVTNEHRHDVGRSRNAL